ncbi:MAG: hypothetical protein KC416_13425, partial [Myxococcales bacterium]|nr:hypothetical protein [Myxococcales bacterium]
MRGLAWCSAGSAATSFLVVVMVALVPLGALMHLGRAASRAISGDVAAESPLAIGPVLGAQAAHVPARALSAVQHVEGRLSKVFEVGEVVFADGRGLRDRLPPGLQEAPEADIHRVVDAAFPDLATTEGGRSVRQALLAGGGRKDVSPEVRAFGRSLLGGNYLHALHRDGRFQEVMARHLGDGRFALPLEAWPDAERRWNAIVRRESGGAAKDPFVTEVMAHNAREMRRTVRALFATVAEAKRDYLPAGIAPNASMEARLALAREEWRIVLDLARAARPDRADLVDLPDAAAIREDIARTIPAYAPIAELSAQGDQFQWGGPRLCEGGAFP